MRRRSVPVERFPITVDAGLTGIIVVRHEATEHVEHITVGPSHPVPVHVFEANQDRVTKTWTLYTTKRGWKVDRFDCERWIAA